MDLRPYLSADRARCLAVFDSNAPHFTSPSDRTAFESYLDHPDGPYYVMEHDGAILGCGGYTVSPDQGLATLVWGMIRIDSQKQGLGRFLLMYRLREIGKASGIGKVHVQTSQSAAPFFEGQGFKAVAAGSGRVELMKKLTVCA